MPQKPNSQSSSLSLRSITGTTTRSSGGLASHYESSTFAYCAGSAVVVAKLDDAGDISYRFFRAQPTALPIHPSPSFYNPASPTPPPESRRRTILPAKHSSDERSSHNSPRRNWADDGSSKTWSARERVKAVSCVALSPNGKFLAAGETGYGPRVNIFSTMPGGFSDIPLTTLTEHSFGVRCVAFSPTSRWLATLGDAMMASSSSGLSIRRPAQPDCILATSAQRRCWTWRGAATTLLRSELGGSRSGGLESHLRLRRLGKDGECWMAMVTPVLLQKHCRVGTVFSDSWPTQHSLVWLQFRNTKPYYVPKRALCACSTTVLGTRS